MRPARGAHPVVCVGPNAPDSDGDTVNRVLSFIKNPMALIVKE